jgi:Resolvase, N terminal domain
VEKENSTIVEVYSDYANSGSSIRNRPGMRALLEGAKSGKFDCVIAEALDRLNDARVKLGLQIGKATRCPQMALSCRASRRQPRQLSGVKRTSPFNRGAAANDPKRT